MRTFYAVAAVLALLFVSLWVNCFHVYCEQCGRHVFHTNLTTVLCGAHRDILHEECLEDYLAGRASQPLPRLVRAQSDAVAADETTI